MTTTEHTITIPALDQYGHVATAEILKLMSRNANVMGSEYDDIAFADAFLDEHNTLQQKMVARMLTTLVALAQLADANRGDQRNAAAMKIAQQVRDILVAEGHIFHPGQRAAQDLADKGRIYNGDHVKLPLI